MKIDPITEKDILSCARSFILFYRQSPWDISWQLKDAEKYINCFVRSSSFKGFMLCHKGVVLAALLGHSYTHQFIIDELFVLPEEMGNGHGLKLLEHTEKHMKALGITSIVFASHTLLSMFHHLAIKMGSANNMFINNRLQ